MRGALDLSPRDHNKLNSYNPTEDFQPNAQTLLRDLRIKASEGEQIGRAREEE